MEIQTILIIGSGLMGRGIAQVSAAGNFKIFLQDIQQSALNEAMDNIKWSLEKLHAKGRIKESPQNILSRITPIKELTNEVSEQIDFAIEVVTEDIEIKNTILAELDQKLRPEAIIASNTSAIPITQLSLAVSDTRKGKVVGTHFFNPVPMMNMVELVKGMNTTNETVEIVKNYIEQIGKKYCVVNRDIAGFVANRIGICAAIEAIKIMEEGISSAEEIDRCMRYAYGWAMGPIETFDMTGLDSAMSAAESIYQETQDKKFLPPVTLKRLVAAGHFGRKTGKGFYDHSK